ALRFVVRRLRLGRSRERLAAGAHGAGQALRAEVGIGADVVAHAALERGRAAGALADRLLAGRLALGLRLAGGDGVDQLLQGLDDGHESKPTAVFSGCRIPLCPPDGAASPILPALM